MGTNNFCRFESDIIYAIGIFPDLDEDEKNDIVDEWYYDDIKNNICQAIEKIEYNTIDEEAHVLQRLFRGDGGKYITTVYTNTTICGIEIELQLHILISAGYYEGASLDYYTEVLIEGDSNNSLKDWHEYFIYKDLQDYSDMNPGMLKIQYKNICRYLDNQAEKMKECINPILKEHCSVKLRQIGSFSNGSGVYEKTTN